MASGATQVIVGESCSFDGVNTNASVIFFIQEYQGGKFLINVAADGMTTWDEWDSQAGGSGFSWKDLALSIEIDQN